MKKIVFLIFYLLIIIIISCNRNSDNINSDSYLRQKGITNIEGFKRDWLGKNVTVKFFDVVCGFRRYPAGCFGDPPPL